MRVIDKDYVDVQIDLIDRFVELSNAEVLTQSEEDEKTRLDIILGELRGNGGDVDFDGDWFPATLIADSYFNEAMDEMLEDLGEKPDTLPVYMKITIDYEMLQSDYTDIEFDGFTYWYR